MLDSDPEGLSWLRFVIAASSVLGLMGALAFGLKYVVARGWVLPMAARGASRRLKVEESLTLDARRRVVLVRCDEAEHLLLLGVTQDIVLSTNRTAPATDKPAKPA